jgi:hypothetical protein
LQCSRRPIKSSVREAAITVEKLTEWFAHLQFSSDLLHRASTCVEGALKKTALILERDYTVPVRPTIDRHRDWSLTPFRRYLNPQDPRIAVPESEASRGEALQTVSRVLGGLSVAALSQWALEKMWAPVESQTPADIRKEVRPTKREVWER